MVVDKVAADVAVDAPNLIPPDVAGCTPNPIPEEAIVVVVAVVVPPRVKPEVEALDPSFSPPIKIKFNKMTQCQLSNRITRCCSLLVFN